MADTAFQFSGARQGHPDAEHTLPTESISADNLPTVIQMGDSTAFQRTHNARINPELHWFHKLSEAVMIAFQPETYAIAKKSILLLQTSATKIVRERIKLAANAFKHGELYSFVAVR